ncbi:MAG: hypothetical protein KME40_34425 [Komarekiella atlantica HA4396-MV6]|jgi:hypothetical protein|nr:hypothetical protein [Komarekiella atlantica HA4396-MV6]
MTDTAFRNRFGSEVFASAFFDDYPLEAEEFRLYVHIQRRAGNSGCFESIPKMAQHCQIAEKTAKHAVKLLLKAGMIRIQQRSGTTNVYTLTPASQWVNPDQVQLLRSQIKKGRVKNDPSQKSTGCNFDPSQKGMGGGGKIDPTGGVIFAPGVGSKMTDEGIPIKEIPIKVLPLRDVPLQNNPLLNDECVCETEQTNLLEQVDQNQKDQNQEELTPQQLTSLLNKSESLQQTDNPSRGATIAAGSFDKPEQSNQTQTCPYKTAQNVKDLIEAWITDPTAFADDFVPLVVKEKIKWNRWVLPWRSAGRKLNHQYQNFNPIVVDFLAAELAAKSKRSSEQEITHAVAVINTWEKTKGGWTNLMQRYHQALKAELEHLQRQQAIQTTHAAPDDLRTSAVLPQVRQARRFSKTEYRSQPPEFRIEARAAAG